MIFFKHYSRKWCWLVIFNGTKPTHNLLKILVVWPLYYLCLSLKWCDHIFSECCSTIPCYKKYLLWTASPTKAISSSLQYFDCHHFWLLQIYIWNKISLFCWNSCNEWFISWLNFILNYLKINFYFHVHHCEIIVHILPDCFFVYVTVLKNRNVDIWKWLCSSLTLSLSSLSLLLLLFTLFFWFFVSSVFALCLCCCLCMYCSYYLHFYCH